MPSKELLRMHTSRLAAILSNLSIVGFVVLSAGVVANILLYGVLTLLAWVILFFIAALSLFFLFFSDAFCEIFANPLKYLFGEINFDNIFAPVAPYVFIATAALLILSIVLFALDRRTSHKKRIVFNSVMLVLSAIFLVLDMFL